MASQILNQVWNNSIPVDPILIARKMGANVYSSKSIGYEGDFFLHKGKPTIVYRPSSSSFHDRFVIAHELGHFVFAHSSKKRGTCDTLANFVLENSNPAEREANRFAVELLMPESVVYFAVCEAGLITVKDLADYFDVSTRSVRIRLKTIGLLNAPSYNNSVQT